MPQGMLQKKYDVAACVGATWIAGGFAGTSRAAGAEPETGRDHCLLANPTGVSYLRRKR